jgi:hypothetical protein
MLTLRFFLPVSMVTVALCFVIPFAMLQFSDMRQLAVVGISLLAGTSAAASLWLFWVTKDRFMIRDPWDD